MIILSLVNFISPDAGVSSLAVPTIVCLCLILLLLIASAAISASEVAFFSLSPSQIRGLQSEKSALSDRISFLLERPKQLIATILIANNFVNITIVVLSTYLLGLHFDFSGSPVIGFFIQVVLITSVILFFGEIVPKIYASNSPLKVISLMSNTMVTLLKILSPFSRIMVKSTSIIDKRMQKKKIRVSLSEISEAISISEDQDKNEQENSMIKGAVHFGDKIVKQIMQFRLDVSAVDADWSFREMLQYVLNSGYSRVPVYKESFDNVIGILHIKDLLPNKSNNEFDWIKLCRQPFFVPENKKLIDLLREFREKKMHLAVVVDEFGGSSGIVTLEDVIEEIVGEISDEFDLPGDDVEYIKVDESSYIFEGKTSLNDFCKILEIPALVFEDLKGGADTLAGLLLEHSGELPAKGSVINIAGFSFRIIAVDNRRIIKVKVTLPG